MSQTVNQQNTERNSSNLEIDNSSRAVEMSDGDPIASFVLFLKKRGWLLVVCPLIGFLCGLIANHSLPKLYTAQANIEIAEDLSSQFRLEQVQELGNEDDVEKMDTEIEILRSRSLALETIQALHLERNPNFVPLINGRAWDPSNPPDREMLIGTFLGGLKLARLGHTSIVQIFVSSKQPELASLIANALIDRYIERSFRDNYSATSKISGWLSTKLNGLKEDLEKSQAHILDLQRDIGLYGIDQSHNVIVANLEELNKQYADAEVERLLKESRLQELKSASPDVIDAGLGNTDPALQATMQRLAQLNSEYTSLSQTYGPAHPRVKALKAQIDLIEKDLRGQERAQISRSQKEYDAALDNESKLRSALDRQEQDAFGKGEKAMEYELARKNYETNRLLYDGLQQRLLEAGIISGLHSTAIHIVDSAVAPLGPSYPRTRLNLAAGAVVGMLLGLGMAFLLEVLDTNLKTMAQIEESLQLPLLAAIPKVEPEDLFPSRFRDAATKVGLSAYSKIAEALRGLRTAILLSRPGASPKVIMVTSMRPADGKSSVSSLSAITFALSGARVLLIDADLRRPSLHLRFKMGKTLGLSSVLSGEATYKEALIPWPELDNLDIMTSGPVAPLPSELLGSRQMEELLTKLRMEYDFIIIDTPPILTVTDTSVMARLADATILIIRYGGAQRHVVRRGIDLLDRSGAHILGVVVNAVDLKAPEYSEYYGGKYNEYYADRESM